MRIFWLVIFTIFSTSSLVQAADISTASPLPDRYVMPFPLETMEIVVAQGQEWSFVDHKHIRVTGQIEPGDAAKLAELLYGENQYDQIVVSLDSRGGGAIVKSGVSLKIMQRPDLD